MVYEEDKLASNKFAVSSLRDMGHFTILGDNVIQHCVLMVSISWHIYYHLLFI